MAHQIEKAKKYLPKNDSNNRKTRPSCSISNILQFWENKEIQENKGKTIFIFIKACINACNTTNLAKK